MEYLIAPTNLAIGFSAISALILTTLYWFSLPLMRKSITSKIACALTLGVISSLQTLHFLHFTSGLDLQENRIYVSLLIITPASLYFFARLAIFQEKLKLAPSSIHIVPAACSVALPTWLVFGIAFTLGATYTLWLSIRIYSLRNHRARFNIEIFFFALFAIMAVLALLLGLFLPLMNPAWFYLFFANCISIAMICVVSAVIAFPSLLEDIVTVTSQAYTKSKLDGVPIETALAKLEKLFREDEIFKQEDVNLTGTAEILGLSAHQLSELVNTYHNMNFPNFVKQFRVKSAERQLLDEPNTSVLAIGLENGFKSQSAFYAAFKEATAQSPGNFRKSNIL